MMPAAVKLAKRLEKRIFSRGVMPTKKLSSSRHFIRFCLKEPNNPDVMTMIKLRVLSDLKKLPSMIRPKLSTFWYYAKVELTPPTPADLAEITNGFKNLKTAYKNKTWKEITVKQAWLNTLVAVEIAGWFFIGECIGKGSLIGYHV